jgi:hypothetical protein
MVTVGNALVVAGNMVITVKNKLATMKECFLQLVLIHNYLSNCD